jgi:hypothetical protein
LGQGIYTFTNLNSNLQLNVASPVQASQNVVQTSQSPGWTLTLQPDPRAKPIYLIKNVNSGLLMGVQDQSFLDGAQIQQYADDGTTDHYWQLEDQGNGYFKIRNLPSNRVLGIDKEATTDSALIKQAADNGTDDHLWSFVSVGNDQYKIMNKLSGLVLGVDQESTANSANVVQFHDTGTPDHLWSIVAHPWPSLYNR